MEQQTNMVSSEDWLKVSEGLKISAYVETQGPVSTGREGSFIEGDLDTALKGPFDETQPMAV